ncbi:GNAT family N-acetyltransferase [Novosphingobium sp. PhB165]|uniref:GNAT family N-acetyltransferase n=1 Tax=Novosphingobium sp. PhB165 TaxID=2485105 RepID=UPI0010441AB4|nr:GNAT family N-acetyltransferase [Novosphingobium sp. PhB165]
MEASARLPSQMLAFYEALVATMLAGCVRRVVAIRESGRPIALLPLCRRPGWFGRWHVAGERQVYEPVDALCRDDAAAAALGQELAWLRRPLRLERVPTDSPLVAALGTAMKGRGLLVVRPATGCPTIAIDSAAPDPEARFNAGRRSDFRRARRRAEAEGEVTFEMHAPSRATFDALFDEAVEIERSGWKGDAGTALGCDPVKAAFFRDFLSRASGEGACRVAFMRIGGKAVAMQLAVEFQRRYWLFKIGFDTAFSRVSPGNLLMLHALADATGRGLLGIELLGEVEPWIMDVWTREAMACVRLQTYPFNLHGLAALAVEAANWLWQRRPGRR